LRDRLSGFQQGVQRGRQATVPVRGPAVTEVSSAEGWTSCADDGWRAAGEVAGDVAATAPGEVTLAGLPRRQPKAHLLPGSVAVTPAEPGRGRDAGAMRDRLSSFQRGVREGRGGTEPADAPDRVEHGFHW
jgi:hypothetical protein